MTYIIVAILIISLILIAAEYKININKAAVAVLACTLGWVLYVGFGTDFVHSQHPDIFNMLSINGKADSTAIKIYILNEVFLPYVGKAAEIALFLLATMNIVSILYINGCFDFFSLWLRTRDSRLLLWKVTAIAFIMSANIDNISTIVIMLTVLNGLLSRTRDRWLYGSAVMLAVNFGGTLTVIGDPLSLVLWTNGAITATDYTLSMLLPCMMGWVIPTWILSRRLPDNIAIVTPALPYRGNDTRLNIWQRLLLLLVGIGGLWFIPTFHDITKLPPFLGALCVLSVLWIVNEIFNHRIYQLRGIRADVPQLMQYNSLQQILYIIGVIMALGVVTETGAMDWVALHMKGLLGNIWDVGIITATISVLLDNFASCMTMFSLHDVVGEDAYYGVGGSFWKMLAYSSAVGGSVIGIGSISGMVMLQMQNVPLGWYIRHVTPWVILAGAISLLVLGMELV